jgi:hypothetical protein
MTGGDQWRGRGSAGPLRKSRTRIAWRFSVHERLISPQDADQGLMEKSAANNLQSPTTPILGYEPGETL